MPSIFTPRMSWMVWVGSQWQTSFFTLDSFLNKLHKADVVGVPLTEEAWAAINSVLNGEMAIGDLKQIKGKVDPKSHILGPIDDDDLINHLTHRRLEPIKRNLSGDHHLFTGRNVEVAFDLFSRMVNIGELDWDDYTKIMEVGYSCAKAICPETIQGDLPYEVRSRHRRGWGIVTGDNTSGGLSGRRPLPLDVLSSGTQGTLLWVWALAATMAAHYHLDSNWNERPAILLIDEIENHLHPAWQRRVIPALLEHFPGLQIFATTHSPFVVAGLKAGQVHLLNRDENGVTATTNTEDVIGWTADEILRTMMGVDEPTDQLTVDRANQLRQLREKEALTSDEEDELNTLRRQVNESLLSKGGHLEAQRERYSDLMQQFLKSRQSELAQDGG